MTDTFSPNLNLDEPIVGGSSDTWGNAINNNYNLLDLLLAGVITGLQLSAAGSTGTFGIAVGAASGMALASAYTKGTGAWAVGTSNGSLDTGTIANSTWYHVYLIQRVDTGVCDILTSLSATVGGIAFPTNYTRARRIGAMKTDGSAHWIAFFQKGDKFTWTVVPVDQSSVNITGTASLLPISVPPGISVEATIVGTALSVSSADLLWFSSPLQAAARTATAQSNVAFNSAGAFNAYQLPITTDTSQQVQVVAQTNCTIGSMGAASWVDPRGKG